MVSELAKGVEITINSPSIARHVAGIESIAEHATIKWGRESLWDEPKPRILQASLVVSTSKIIKNATLWLGNYIDVSIHGVTYFLGRITDLEFNRHNQNESLVKISAQERPNSQVDSKITTNAPNTTTLKTALQIQNQHAAVTIESERSTFFDRGNLTAQEITRKDAYEALVNTRPLAHGTWSPDGLVVRPTLWNLDQPVNKITYPSSAIVARPAHYNISDLPNQVIYTSGGYFGDKRQNASSYISNRDSKLYRESNTPFAIRNFGSGDETKALALLDAQTTSPRTFVLYDDRIRLNPALGSIFMNFFTPWENPTVALRLDTPLFETPTQTDFVLIGGTLDLAYKRTAHTVTAIYASPPTEGRSWRNGYERWNETPPTRKWKDFK